MKRHSTTRLVLLLLWLVAAVGIASIQAFSISNPNNHIGRKAIRGGGRAPTRGDDVVLKDDDDNVADSTVKLKTGRPYPFLRPNDASEVRLIVLQVTDVYTLEHFASFKTLLQETRAKAKGAKVVCMLTGDFLSPYLLSSVDGGAGMMQALSNIPMDYLTIGNHEADIDHEKVCVHFRQFPGTIINSNMLDHDAMDSMKEYDVITVSSPDGSHVRKIGLCAVLSNDEALYRHFPAPGAFGGAASTMMDPWEALQKYDTILKHESKCDLVIPLQHLYAPDDYKTCAEFDFPVILSGHDHHKIDQVVNGTRLIKPGMNAEFATVLEVSWNTASKQQPTIKSRFVKCSDWEPCPIAQAMNDQAYDVLEPMQNTELARVPPTFEPLSSNGARECVCSMGQFICTVLKNSMNDSRKQSLFEIDAVLLMGGNIRGGKDYEIGSFFSLEALEAEIKEDEVVGVVPMPGWLLAKGIQATHSGDPISGWFQFDNEIIENTNVFPPVITHVGGKPIDDDRFYRVATKISDLTNGQSPPLTKYYTENPHLLPSKGAYVNIQSELMTYFAKNLWNKLWDVLSDEVPDECNDEECEAEERLAALDTTGDGTVTVDDIVTALEDKLGYSVDERELAFAEEVLNIADVTGGGEVTVDDLEIHCVLENADDEALEHFRLPEPEIITPPEVLADPKIVVEGVDSPPLAEEIETLQLEISKLLLEHKGLGTDKDDTDEEDDDELLMPTTEITA